MIITLSCLKRFFLSFTLFANGSENGSVRATTVRTNTNDAIFYGGRPARIRDSIGRRGLRCARGPAHVSVCVNTIVSLFSRNLPKCNTTKTQ
ncbi:hypothetical protein AB6A40_006092 [Gnathostoma spinigerum]|uniref:Secreted protein n=1 Tax=Gnathostoma spinigerum TaxID=75299 RepID=A0ABD6EHJ8_9BILA